MYPFWLQALVPGVTRPLTLFQPFIEAGASRPIHSIGAPLEFSPHARSLAFVHDQHDWMLWRTRKCGRSKSYHSTMHASRRWSGCAPLECSFGASTFKIPSTFKSRWRTPLAESMFPTVVIIPQRLYWPNWAFEMRKVSLAASYNLAEVVQGRGCAQLSVNHPVHPGEISSLRTTQTFSNLGIFACKHSVPEI